MKWWRLCRTSVGAKSTRKAESDAGRLPIIYRSPYPEKAHPRLWRESHLTSEVAVHYRRENQLMIPGVKSFLILRDYALCVAARREVHLLQGTWGDHNGGCRKVSCCPPAPIAKRVPTSSCFHVDAVMPTGVAIVLTTNAVRYAHGDRHCSRRLKH